MRNLLVVAGLAVTLTSQTVSAGLINITDTSLPDLITLSGHSSPTPSDPIAEKSAAQGDAQLFAWLQTQNLISGHPLENPADILKSGSSPTGLDLSSYIGDYLVVHWGVGPAGKFFTSDLKGGFDQAFYIGAGTGTISLTLPSFTGDYQNGQNVKTGTLNVGGLSFWRVYDSTTVPDGGMTLMLLGGALSGLGLIRKKLS